jgi:uncharacterized membrane protein
MTVPPLTARRVPAAGLALGIFALILALTWLYWTPHGLLGKADAAGYAVCHRIAERSFFLGDRPLPLCARCSGLFLGALLGLAYQARGGRRGDLPAKPLLGLFGLLLLAFAVDGVNSFLHLLPGAPGLYEPTNTLRLITGTGVGLGIAALVYPLAVQTVFPTWQSRPALGTGKEIGGLFLLAAVLDGLILTENPLLLYPLAVLSGLAVLLVLGLCYTLVWILVLRREGAYPRLQAAWLPLLAGLTTALLQVAVIDLGRFWWTGTWGGLPL